MAADLTAVTLGCVQGLKKKQLLQPIIHDA